MDRLQAMEAFVATVDAGSLAAAARQLGVSPPMVGKHIRALEAHLGASLLKRTTRRQSLTELGRTYHERCKRVLGELRQAEASVDALRSAPRGCLRISAPVSFGTQCLSPALVDFLAPHPELSVELILNDRLVDLVADEFDVAVRIGKLADSSLIARRLAPYAMAICAAPSYLARAGTPQSPPDLERHQCLGFTHWKRGSGWRLGPDDNPTPALSRFVSNHGPALRAAALQGFGLVLQPRVLVADDLAAGRLVPVLEKSVPPALPVHLVYPRDRLLLPKLRSFIDFAVQRFGVSLEEPAPNIKGARPKLGQSPARRRS